MASVGHGNRLIPDQCCIVAKAITAYYLFPADTFVDPDGESVSYTAPSPWDAFTRQLLTSTGNVKFNPGSRQIYGTPSASLLLSGETSHVYPVTIIAKSLDGSTDSLAFTFRVVQFGTSEVRFGDRAPSLSVASDLSVGSVTAVAGDVSADEYSIVWSSENAVGAGYGVNSSPFSISNSGVITVTGSLEVKTYYLWVKGRKASTGVWDNAYVTITSAYTSAVGGYQLIDARFGGLCK